jgi:hypothetical protein
MKHGVINDLPNFSVDVYNVTKKSGSRVEYSLSISEELLNIGSQISDLPLRFASIVHATPSFGPHQDFHYDDNSGERAIVYLTDVETETSGPIEFQQFGKVFGKKGTYVKYSASEIHRGCSSDVNRFALALAFDADDKVITTIGSTCVGYNCPPGCILKNPPPDNITLSTEVCCDYVGEDSKSDNTVLIVVIVVVLVILLTSY